MAAKKKRGRKPETLKIEGPWQDAVGKAMKRGKPPTPKPAPRKSRQKKTDT